LKVGYDGPPQPMEKVLDIAQRYVENNGLGVTVTPTHFVYPGGNEPGVIVGLIDYPRFPKNPEIIRWHALLLGGMLKDELRQERLSIVFPDKTVMLGEK
jgi:hypothetical protein